MATRRRLHGASKQHLREDLHYIQNGNCNNRYCLKPKKKWRLEDLELDHIKPLGDGGTDAEDNLQLLCRDCHTRKTRREDQARVKARNEPKTKSRRKRRKRSNQPELTASPVTNPCPVRSSGTMSGGTHRRRTDH
ncbi:HNH endonuclease [Candidatus Poriferisodalis sp.]|uniref:HNH endonuclease n=1 Tax=Candidatus Poriferisodalis sp. TaxID=3101277 RepID=UPI003B5C128B